MGGAGGGGGGGGGGGVGRGRSFLSELMKYHEDRRLRFFAKTCILFVYFLN